MEVARYAIQALTDRRSEVVNAVTLSTYTGMRVEETTCLKVKNIRFEKGEFEFGYVVIVKGPEGGAKGGRPRFIPIIDKEAQGALRSITAGKKPDDYVVARVDGENMTPDNVSDKLCEVLKEEYGDKYLYNGCHGLRKTWAQRYYNLVRPNHTKSQAVGKTNAVLGHGYNRGSSGLKRYVANMW